MFIQFNVATAYISRSIFFNVLLFKISYLALKSTYSYAAQQIRLTSSQLLGTDPDTCRKSRLETSRQKPNKRRAIKKFLSDP